MFIQCSCNTASIEKVAQKESKDILHTSVNEIWGDELFRKEGASYFLNTEAEHLFYDTELVKDTTSGIEFWTEWSGTSGSERKTFTYFLLEGATYPTVLQSIKQEEDFRSSSIYRETKADNYDFLIEDHKEKEVYDFVQNIAGMTILRDDYQEAFEIRLWQKIGTNWEQMPELFPKGLKQMIRDYIPIYEGSKEDPGLFFDRIYLDYLDYDQAKILRKELYQGKEGAAYFLNYENKMLTIGTSPTHVFRLKWENGRFNLIEKPAKKPSIQKMYTESCDGIRFVEGKWYRFRGKVGTSTIEMELMASQLEGADFLAGKGSYDYTSTKNKMEVFTDCLNQPILNKRIVIVRNKEDNVREQFWGKWTSDCKIEGTWAHWGTLKMEDFYLELLE